MKLEQSITKNNLIRINTGEVAKRATAYEILNSRIIEVLKDYN